MRPSSSSSRPTPSRPSSSTRSNRPKNLSRTSSHRSTISAQKIDIRINVYDLLPPGKLSSVLWAIGGSLLHSGVVIRDKEYAYGGHDRRGVTGVYHTRPRLEPPGGTFRIEILHGFVFHTDEEIEDIIKEASRRFQGTSYNLLTNNCNHFTSYLCEQLTSRPAPKWINRAASIGVALPCVVPRDWIAPPDVDTADGELVEEDDDSYDERTRMLRKKQMRKLRVSQEEQSQWNSEMDRIGEGHIMKYGTATYEAPRIVSLRDSSGRGLPNSERAPLPKRHSSYTM
ncbi:DUF862-domain-containing protein [Trichodelitschia bisporula]|uniref:DUF862-domain-containing protein n=1 Tax=Trichodelitschia bisporula TaxID=703511 RepID=A0A6G1HZ37_9PEZI|nr:DUF862-domain-containing protein [Trichodelitschia bisporula]